MRSRLPIILILAIGLCTPIASTLLYFWWTPDSYSNVGTVLTPNPISPTWQRTNAANVAAGDSPDWAGKWVILTASGGACGAACQQNLCQARQLHHMLYGHYFRVQRAWLVTDNTPPPETIRQNNDCGVVDADLLQDHVKSVETLEEVAVVHGAAATLPLGDGAAPDDYLFLIDPQGRWAMRFTADTDIYKVRQDIKRLLKLSKGHKALNSRK